MSMQTEITSVALILQFYLLFKVRSIFFPPLELESLLLTNLYNCAFIICNVQHMNILDLDENATLLTSIFISLLEIGSINMRLSRLKKNLMKYIITPLLKNRNSWKASIKVVDDVTTKLFVGVPSDDEDSNGDYVDQGK